MVRRGLLRQLHWLHRVARKASEITTTKLQGASTRRNVTDKKQLTKDIADSRAEQYGVEIRGPFTLTGTGHKDTALRVRGKYVSGATASEAHASTW